MHFGFVRGKGAKGGVGNVFYLFSFFFLCYCVEYDCKDCEIDSSWGDKPDISMTAFVLNVIYIYIYIYINEHVN